MGKVFLCVSILCGLTLFSAPEQLLFKLSKGVSTNYLYGTLSIKDESLLKFPDHVYDAFLASDVVCTEITYDSWDSFSALPKIFLPEGEVLKDHLTEDTWGKLQAAFEKYDFPFSLSEVSKRQAWFVMSEISDFVQTENHKVMDQDLFFQTISREMQRRVSGLQTPSAKIDVMSGFSREEIDFFLSSTLDDILSVNSNDDQILIDWYNRGATPEAFDEFFLTENEEGNRYAQNFLQKMFYDRIDELTDLLVSKIENESESIHFFALNIGLLVGEKSIIESLRERGYEVSKSE